MPFPMFSDDWAPKPTVFNGGPDRQIQIWEACRNVNAGGYGSGVVQTIKSMGCAPNKSQVTSCSPFTATAIGMMFDTRPGATQTDFEPMFDNATKPLGSLFYQMHNGNYFAIDHDPKMVKITTERSKARYAQWTKNKWPAPASSWDDSAMACVWFNLGYLIDPRDMRRGDLVAVDWAPSNGGHAVFVWDVHLNGDEVDCFTFLSSNGTSAGGGAGISIYCYSLIPSFFTKSSSGYTSVYSPTFADRDEYVKYGAWHALPKKLDRDIDRSTFKQWPLGIIDANSYSSKRGYSEYVGSLRVLRFWGVAPPANPHGTLLGDNASLAHQLTKWQPPDSKCMGSSKPPDGRVPKIAPKPVPKTAPDPIKAAPPKPAPPQPQEHVVAHQHSVESELAELYAAKWIDVNPGDPKSIGDGNTKAAVEDFQRKFHVPPIDGIAGQKTRPAIDRAIADLRAGKPNPVKAPPAPAIDRFYWLANRGDPGGAGGLAITSSTIDGDHSFEITVTDQRNTSSTLPISLHMEHGRGVCAFAIPTLFANGSTLTAHLRGAVNGTTIDKATTAPLYIGSVAPAPQADWPWDESKWNDYMRGVLAELRATPKGPGSFAQREITQYGVKEALKPGDVQIMSKVGGNAVALALPPVDKLGLYLSDIEGTLRWQGHVLNIVQSGNVYDKPVTRVINGVTVTKMKPTLEKFDPMKSLWVDVTAQHPWGSGARMPLIPFRVLAHNARTEPSLYGRIVYIQQLDGLALPTGETHNGMCVVGDAGGMSPPGKQFDFFVGREDRHITLPSLAASQGGSVCNVEILGPCAAYSKPHR